MVTTVEVVATERMVRIVQVYPKYFKAKSKKTILASQREKPREKLNQWFIRMARPAAPPDGMEWGNKNKDMAIPCKQAPRRRQK